MDAKKLHQLVREFDVAARPRQSDSDAPVTVGELNHLVTQLSFTLDKMIDEIAQK